MSHIPTRQALISRGAKIRFDIDEYFADAAGFGLTVEQADPDGVLQKIHKALCVMLDRERELLTRVKARANNV